MCVVATLMALIVFGALRYDNFLSPFNILTFLRYNSMFALIALGMAFVIMTGGIDLSVGGVAALPPRLTALLSPFHWAAGLAGGLAAGLMIGMINGLVVTRLRIQPFIATLAAMLAAYGTALLLAKNQSVSVSYESGFTSIGQDDFLGFPIPAWIAALAYAAGWVVLERHPIGRRILAIGDGDLTARLMGLKVGPLLFGVYASSGFLAGLAVVILASQFGAGQPTEGYEDFQYSVVLVEIDCIQRKMRTLTTIDYALFRRELGSRTNSRPAWTGAAPGSFREVQLDALCAAAVRRRPQRMRRE